MAAGFRRLVLVLLLVTPAFAGCVGGSDDAGDSGDAEGVFQALCPAPCEHPLLDEPHTEFEPSVAVNPTDPDNILVGVYEAVMDPLLTAVVSHDHGQSWTRVPLPTRPTAEPGSQWNLFCGMGDPVVFFGPDATAYFLGLGFGCEEGESYIFLAESSDGGLTWSEPSIVWQGPWFLQFQDKPWGAVDPVTGNLAASWSAFGALAAALVDAPVSYTQELLVSVSTDGGTFWSTPPSVVATSLPVPVPGVEPESWFYNYFSMPAWGTGGALHVVFRACEGYCFKVATSRDLGESWETTQAAQIELVEREGAQRVGTSAVLGVDRTGGEHDGRIYLSYADAGRGGYDVIVRWSDDGARSWSEPVRLNDNPVDDGTDQFQHWMDVDEQGVVHAFFLDRRNDPENLLVQASYARYDPATGDLWNEHLSEPWHPDPADEGRPQTGHYEGIAASGGTVAAAWTRVMEPGPDQDPCCGDQNIHVAVFESVKASTLGDQRVPP